MIFSNTGVSCLHGPHQGAQKSTIINFSLLPSITFSLNCNSSTSIIFVALFIKSWLYYNCLVKKYLFLFHFQE